MPVYSRLSGRLCLYVELIATNPHGPSLRAVAAVHFAETCCSA